MPIPEDYASPTALEEALEGYNAAIVSLMDELDAVLREASENASTTVGMVYKNLEATKFAIDETLSQIRDANESMAPKIKVGDRFNKIVYDSWFQLVVGGVIIAVFTLYLPGLIGFGTSVEQAQKIPDTGLILGETYRIVGGKSYAIDDQDFDSGTLVSLRWHDGKLTTRDEDTDEVIKKETESIRALLSSSTGQSWTGPITQGVPFTAGNCASGGLVMNLIEQPSRKEGTFLARFLKQKC